MFGLSACEGSGSSSSTPTPTPEPTIPEVAQIIKFSLPDSNGTPVSGDIRDGTILVEFPESSAINLQLPIKATFTTSPANAQVFVESQLQTSGETTQVFESPVVYTVISKYGIETKYTVTASNKYLGNDFIKYGVINGDDTSQSYEGSIDGDNITLDIPDTVVATNNLKVNFTHNTGAAVYTVTDGKLSQAAVNNGDVVVFDTENKVTYKVFSFMDRLIHKNGHTYTMTLKKLTSPSFKSFGILFDDGSVANGEINNETHRIYVNSTTPQQYSIITTGATLKVQFELSTPTAELWTQAYTQQIKSKVTGQNFSNLTKTYEVKAVRSPDVRYVLYIEKSPFSCKADGGNACGCLIQNDGSGLIWYNQQIRGSWSNWCIGDHCTKSGNNELSKFNLTKHCGLNNWQLPDIGNVAHSGERVDSSLMGGTLGALGMYAEQNGYAANFNTWLNQVGFSVAENIFARFWIKNYRFDGGVFNLEGENGEINAAQPVDRSYNILLVANMNTK